MEAGFESVPLHGYVHLFHLEWHRNLWVHVQHLTEYRYQPELRDKLVLPDHHCDLIDILTSHMDVLVQDFVPGKSGGTTILCQGAPGLGKTLTAEVYAEVVGKPLYRVHSGQLGTTAASVGASLGALHRHHPLRDARQGRCAAPVAAAGGAVRRRAGRRAGRGAAAGLPQGQRTRHQGAAQAGHALCPRAGGAADWDVFRLCGQFRGLN